MLLASELLALLERLIISIELYLATLQRGKDTDVKQIAIMLSHLERETGFIKSKLATTNQLSIKERHKQKERNK